MASFFMALILCFTVIGSLAVGIGIAYGVVTGILYAFGRSSRESARPRLVLVPSQNPASGD